MLGGGPGSFIGGIHQMGAKVAGIDLVAGVFSSSPEKSRVAALNYGVAPERCYPTSEAMFAAEAARADGIDMVTIATPNHLHLPAALQAIAAGVDIMSDKPATATLAEALLLREALAKGESHYALSFTYGAYPMVREARARIAAGEIGTVRKTVVTYAQGGLATPAPQGAAANWRTDPAQAGIGGCVSDIGTHAFNLAEYVTGQSVAWMLAELSSNVAGRTLDDDCTVMLRFDGGGRGLLVASQIAFGERNELSFSIYGDAGAVHWNFAQADMLRLVRGGEASLLTPMSPGLLTRVSLPRGIGNGLIAPFATLYGDFAAACAGNEALIDDVLPGIEAGVRSMRFVERAIESSAANAGWVTLDA
jgi:predicted dehydrogenase